MCGIAIAIGEGQEEITRKMGQALSHRGLRVGDVYSYCDNRIHICHARLPIQGISNQYDPPYSTGRYSGFLVGEVFNYKSFNKEAKTDLSILVEAFSKKGVAAFEMFDGFWSAVIVDRYKEILHLFLDDMGKKPLYYRVHRNNFYIASEIKALLVEGFPPVTFDEIYFGTIYKFGYSTEHRTPFNEIKKLEINSHLSLSPLSEVYSFKKLLSHKGRSPYLLRESLEQAVKNRLVSDVQVSLLVSGGLDSSIIYKLVEKHTHDFVLFHVDNEEAEFLNYLNIPGDIRVQKLSLDNIDLKEVLFWNETPVDLGSMVPQYALGKAIKEAGIHVAISGDGADELFGGYRRAKEYDSQLSDLYHEIVFYHLPRLDKLMMAHTIELRSPFLSRPVIECALSIPYYKRTEKEFLKEIFCDIVPPEIINRKKVPLKINELRNNKKEWREKLIKIYRRIYEHR